tara:strand:- start:310 stop:795 length:486 start_codon:yes stop_codon:yes gene_type:complete
MLKTAVAALTIALSSSQDPWTVEYVSFVEGPRTVYEGTVRLLYDENTVSRVDFTFDVVPGRLAGPSISSDPGQPMLPFDEVRVFDGEVYINWERSRSDLQPNPVECPRYFKFYVIKQEFDADDLAELLSEWGEQGSVWDLNGDNIVDGKDLAIILGGWKVD